MDTLDRLGWARQLTIEAGTSRVAVRTTSRAFGDWLAEELAPLSVNEPARVGYSVVIGGGNGGEGTGNGLRRSRPFHILYRGNTQVVRTLHLSTLASALLADLESLTFSRRDDAIYLRGTLLETPGGAVLAPGGLLPLLNRVGGAVEETRIRLPALDLVAVDAQSGALTALPIGSVSCADALSRLPQSVPSSGSPDRSLVDHPRLVDVVVTTERGPESILEPVTRAVALHRLVGRVVNLPVTGGAALRGLHLLIGRARCYRLVSTNARSTLRTLATHLIAAQERASSGAR
ncbi:MAG: hypothetical protein ACRDHM_09345 [Actinomycetota bacterium]